MKSCTINRMIIMTIVIIGICSIEESEGFFLKNLPETQTHEQNINFPLFNQATAIPNTTHIINEENHRNVSETFEDVSTQIVNFVKDNATSVLNDHVASNQQTSNVQEESNQIDTDARNIPDKNDNEIPSTEDIERAIEHHDSNDPEVNIVKLPEEDSQDVVTVLEDNIRSSVKDEIQLEQNFESSAIDVIEDIPDPEIRQTLTEDLMAIEYPQSVKNTEESESVTTPAASTKEEKLYSTQLQVELTTVPNTISEQDITSLATSNIESTTSNSLLIEESTNIAVEVDNTHSLEISDETNQISLRQMRGFDKGTEDDKSNQSSDLSANSSSYSSGSSANNSHESELVAKDENVAAEETSEEKDEVISPDASVEGSFQKEDITMQQSLLPKISPTPRPYIANTTPAPLTYIAEDTETPILIEQITESSVAVLNDVAVTIGDGNHIVIRKPGVNADNPRLTSTDAEVLASEITTDTTVIIDHNDETDQIPISKDERSFKYTKFNEMPYVTQKDEKDNFIVDEDVKNPNLNPTLPTPVRVEQDIITKQLEEMADHQRQSLEIVHAPTLPVNLNQQLNNDIETYPQESGNVDQIDNQIHLTEAIYQNNFEATSERSISEESEYLQHDALNGISKNAFENDENDVAIKQQNFESVTFETPSEKPLTHSNEDQTIQLETSTERASGRSTEYETTPALVHTLIEAAELTTEFARHVDSFRTISDEASAISDEIISTAAAGRSFNAIVAEGLGKPLPTRSVSDEPSTSSYSSEDKTTTVVVLCSSAAIIFIAFSIAMYLITFQRQHGTLDIEMQEQQCGKDDLEENEDAETRVTLLNQHPQADSDAHSFE